MVIRLPQDVKDGLIRAGADEMRTMSAMAVWVLTRWLQENRYLEPTEAPRPARKRSGQRGS